MIGIKAFIQNLFHLKWDKEPNDFEERVRALVHEFDELNESGEYKRHQVYARLIKEYPKVPHHTIGLEIEMAVGELRA